MPFDRSRRRWYAVARCLLLRCVDGCKKGGDVCIYTAQGVANSMSKCQKIPKPRK